MNNDPHAQALYQYTRWLATPRRPAAPPVNIGPHPLVAHIERVIGRAG